MSELKLRPPGETHTPAETPPALKRRPPPRENRARHEGQTLRYFASAGVAVAGPSPTISIIASWSFAPS